MILEITANPNGTLNWQGHTLIETSPNFFQTLDGEYKIFFLEDANERVKYAGNNVSPTYTFEKIEWYDYADFQYFLMIFSLIIFCLTALIWLIIIIKQRIRKKILDKGKFRLIRVIMGISCLLNLFVFLGYILWMQYATFSISDYNLTQLLSLLPIISTIFAFLTITYPVITWKRRHITDGHPRWKRFDLGYSILIVIANIIFIYSINYWHILGFTLFF